MDSVLQKVLRTGMLAAIGSDDSKFEVLKKASEVVRKGIEKDRTQVVPYVLVALDPHIASDDPVIMRVGTAVEKHWATYSNAFSDTPRQILRAIILDALQGAGKDAVLAAAIRLTGDSYLSYADLGNERAIVEEFLLELRDQAEAKAADEWTSSIVKAPTKLTLKVDTPELKLYSPNEKTLATHLAAASGPTDAEGAALSNANSVWSNSGEIWSQFFVPRAAKGIAEVVGKAQADSQGLIAAALSELVVQVNEQLDQLAEAKQSVDQSRTRNSAAQEWKTELLWWREALYSPSLRRGYRELLSEEGSIVVSATMAFDLSQQLPALCPLSVEYFLREVVRDVTSGATYEAHTISEVLKVLLRSSTWPNLKTIPSTKSSTSNGRTSLLRFLLEPENENYHDASLLDRLGMRADVLVPLEDLAVWLWRDSMTERLLANRMAPPNVGA